MLTVFFVNVKFLVEDFTNFIHGIHTIS